MTKDFDHLLKNPEVLEYRISGQAAWRALELFMYSAVPAVLAPNDLEDGRSGKKLAIIVAGVYS